MDRAVAFPQILAAIRVLRASYRKLPMLRIPDRCCQVRTESLCRQDSFRLRCPRQMQLEMALQFGTQTLSAPFNAQIPVSRAERIGTVSEVRARQSWPFVLAAILGLVIVGAIVALERGLGCSPSAAGLMAEAFRSAPRLAAVLIFTATYFAVGIGRLPGFRRQQGPRRLPGAPGAAHVLPAARAD